MSENRYCSDGHTHVDVLLTAHSDPQRGDIWITTLKKDGSNESAKVRAIPNYILHILMTLQLLDILLGSADWGTISTITIWLLSCGAVLLHQRASLAAFW